MNATKKNIGKNTYMAKDPAFLFYYQDFLVGTTFMTLEEKGAYILLLCHLADKGGITEKDVLKIIPAPIWGAICCKFKNEDGMFFNERLRKEVEKRHNFTLSRRKNLHMDTHMGTHMRGKSKPHMEDENIDANANADVIENIEEHGSKVTEILDSLNLVLGSRYRSTRKLMEMVGARLKEGFTIDDFKEVHRKKFIEWGNDAKMSKFLRPTTLYGTKFQDYLNQPEKMGRMLTDAQKSNVEQWGKFEERMIKNGYKDI